MLHALALLVRVVVSAGDRGRAGEKMRMMMMMRRRRRRRRKRRRWKKRRTERRMKR